MPGVVIMEKVSSCARVAHLRLQQVVPICNKAISQFKTDTTNEKQMEVQINQDVSYGVYAWIDSDLFTETLVILLKDLANCPGSDGFISLKIKRIGSSICRILVTGYEEVNLTECEGPMSVSECPISNSALEDAQTYVAMHGGYMQIWKKSGSSQCLFEINLLCMSKNWEMEL